MPKGGRLTVWLLVALVLWSSYGCFTSGVDINALPKHYQINNQDLISESEQAELKNIARNGVFSSVNSVLWDSLPQVTKGRKLLGPPAPRLNQIRINYIRNFLRQKTKRILSHVASRANQFGRNIRPVSAARIQNLIISKKETEPPLTANLIQNDQPGDRGFENEDVPSLKKRSKSPTDSRVAIRDRNEATGKVGQSKLQGEKEGYKEISSSLRNVSKGISEAFLRSVRKVPWDIPQIVCPASDDMERFPCPSPDRMGRYRCIDEHLLCDGFIDCPSGEDENRQQCMFYKMTKAHLDILADAIIRWARGGK